MPLVLEIPSVERSPAPLAGGQGQGAHQHHYVTMVKEILEGLYASGFEGRSGDQVSLHPEADRDLGVAGDLQPRT